MATHRKQPASPSTPPRPLERGPKISELSDLEAPTNAFPIGQGLSGRRSDRGAKGQKRPASATPLIDWNDERTDGSPREAPIDNDIDDLLEDVPFEDPPREITIPAWMLLVWFACATVLFGLAIIALVAALLFA